MTHPLTPREKVAAFKEELERRCLMLGDAEYLSTYRAAMNEAYLLAEKMFGLTALASSSGDHAGLSRLADEAADFGVPAQVDPAVLNALLAENAALREQHEADVAEVARAGQNLQSQRIAITEAAACIREMVEWRPIETAPRDGTVVLGWSSFFPTRRPLEVSWDDDRYARKPAPRWVACAAAYNRRAFFEHPLTHWLPLPPAPGAEA